MQIAIIILVGSILLLGLILAASARHKKSGTENLRLIGAIGRSATRLAPEGSVIVCGELWPAISSNGKDIPENARVRLVGFKDHLALVSGCD